MGKEAPVKVVLGFLEAIRSRDVVKLCAPATEDHVLVDALGNTVKGRESMRKAWTRRFPWFPDYRVSHQEIFSDRERVAASGSAEGSYAPEGHLAQGNHGKAPAAWGAMVQKGWVKEWAKEWRVYADNRAARKIMGSPNP
jgi:ketosteroid isomerase-like protein